MASNSNESPSDFPLTAVGHHVQNADDPPPSTHVQNADDPPPSTPAPALPHPSPASAAAGAVSAIEEPSSDDEEPLTPAQIATKYDKMESGIRESVQQTRSEDASLPPSQIAALVDEKRGDDKAADGTKTKAPRISELEDGPPPMPATISSTVEQERVLSFAAAAHQETRKYQAAAAAKIFVRNPQVTEGDDAPKAPVAAPPDEPPKAEGEGEGTPTGASPPPLAAQGQRPQIQQISIRPPPLSMRQIQDEDPDREPTAPMFLELEATLVEDRPEASAPPDIPVYDAFPLEEQTWFEKNKKIIIGLGMGLLIGAVVAGISVGSNNGSSDAITIEPKGDVLSLSTARPSESSSPSEVPSLQSTARPSESSSPSQPRLTPPPSRSSNPSKAPSSSLRPTQLPSASASFQPSQSLFPSISLSPSLHPSKSLSPSTYWSTLNWNRQGLGFNGDVSSDRFGIGVAFSADASTMAIGAPGLWKNEDRPGHVKVYRREGEGSSWERRGDTIYGDYNGDLFGHSLALSEDGTSLAVGALLNGCGGPESGQVQVYEWDEAALGYLQIGDALCGATGDRFGWSVDISNGILAVGATLSDAGGADSGQVTVFAYDDASSNYKQRGQALNGDAAGDWLGASVTLAGDGDKLAAGAYYSDANGSGSGQVKVFEWNEATSLYVQLGESILGDAAGDWFGYEVSFSGDGRTLASVAPRHSTNGPDSGQAKVFAWDEDASNFKQIGQSLYGNSGNDYFGTALGLSSDGKTMAVGAYQFNDGPGYAQVYGWDEAASEYKRLGKSLSGEADKDWFGSTLALSRNGAVLAVAAPANNRNGNRAGRVEVFDFEL